MMMMMIMMMTTTTTMSAEDADGGTSGQAVLPQLIERRLT